MSLGSFNRRNFLRRSGLAATGAASAAYFPWSQSAFANLAANDRPMIGCPRFAGSLNDFPAIGIEFREINVCMGIDKLH